MTQRVEAMLNEKKACSIDWYTNCYEWLGWMKEEVDFKRFQLTLKDMLGNKFLKIKEKIDCLMFFYPAFQSRVEEVRKMYKSKNKEFKFECKPMLEFIWEK